jgi:hypothetical protein
MKSEMAWTCRMYLTEIHTKFLSKRLQEITDLGKLGVEGSIL